MEELDVIVIGAGLSGICALHTLSSTSSQIPLSFVALESRPEIGGTWSFFKYPGFRNDSSMFTFGFGFNPWRQTKHIVEGSQIKKYLNETVDKFDLRKHIKTNVCVTKCDFSKKTGKWTVTTKDKTYIASYIISATGYYDYSKPHFPAYDGTLDFTSNGGTIMHAQFWDDDLSLKNKTVSIIGSGATAITILPMLVAQGVKVNLIQRSPTYIVPMPSTEDNLFSKLILKYFGEYGFTIFRYFHLWIGYFFFWYCTWFPMMARISIKTTAFFSLQVSSGDFRKNYNRHFTPKYNPWQQRLCLSPDNDFYSSVVKPNCSVHTGIINRFNSKGVELADGSTVDTDVLVYATGLTLLPLGGIKLTVDGKETKPADTVMYKSYHPSSIPNLFVLTGYLNSSWTLRVELTMDYVGRILRKMRKQKYDLCYPVFKEKDRVADLLGFNSGYIVRGGGLMPQQGKGSPWVMWQNYARDWWEMTMGSLDDGVMKFERIARKEAVEKRMNYAEKRAEKGMGNLKRRPKQKMSIFE
ncbi:hypothetical protein TrLO_g6267 [Triparma laevis f. longispina]|uniref:Flavin-containing monooxygenase n=2 Tax=Triparma laevis TaxID=1534972 RepID=A0A9W7AV45_9STRA|nr:hypothetical protein TrLO_g6267 [Triparma laevis f. longispina]